MQANLDKAIARYAKAKRNIYFAIVSLLFFFITLLPLGTTFANLDDIYVILCSGCCLGFLALGYIAILLKIFKKDYKNTPQYKLLTTEQQNIQYINLTKIAGNPFRCVIVDKNSRGHYIDFRNQEEMTAAMNTIKQMLPQVRINDKVNN